MTPEQQKSRRLAVALLLAAALAIVAIVVVPFYLLNRHYDAALGDMAGMMDRYKRIAGSRPEATRQLETLRSLEPRKAFLRSGAAALSAAEAQEALRVIIEGNGGRLITMQAPTAKEEGRYRQVTVNVQMTANIFALRKILHAIESNTPNLFVDNLTVRTQVPPNFKPAAGQEPEMFVQLDVSGYSIAAAG
jgi:general secretion pathway protein M